MAAETARLVAEAAAAKNSEQMLRKQLQEANTMFDREKQRLLKECEVRALSPPSTTWVPHGLTEKRATVVGE